MTRGEAVHAYPADWRSLSSSERSRAAEAAVSAGDVESLAALTTAYLEASGRPPSPATRRSYGWSIRRLLELLPREEVLTPTEEAAARLVEQLENEGASTATLNVHIVGARAFYRALAWAEAGRSEAFEAIRIRPKERPAEVEKYTPQEVEALVAAADRRDEILVRLAADAGIGISEAVRLRPQNVDFAAGVAHVSTERGVARQVTLPRVLLSLLTQELARGGERFLGVRSEVQARERVRRLCERAGVQYRGYRPLIGSSQSSASGERLRREPEIIRAAHEASGDGFRVADITELRQELSRALSEWERLHVEAALVLIQLTGFEAIVETVGKDVADALLQAAASRLARIHRPYDLLAQADASTFAILLRNLPSATAANAIAPRFSSALTSGPIVVDGNQITLSVRASVAGKPMEPDSWIEAAEASEAPKAATIA